MGQEVPQAGQRAHEPVPMQAGYLYGAPNPPHTPPQQVAPIPSCEAQGERPGVALVGALRTASLYCWNIQS